MALVESWKLWKARPICLRLFWLCCRAAASRILSTAPWFLATSSLLAFSSPGLEGKADLLEVILALLPSSRLADLVNRALVLGDVVLAGFFFAGLGSNQGEQDILGSLVGVELGRALAVVVAGADREFVVAVKFVDGRSVPFLAAHAEIELARLDDFILALLRFLDDGHAHLPVLVEGEASELGEFVGQMSM